VRADEINIEHQQDDKTGDAAKTGSTASKISRKRHKVCAFAVFRNNRRGSCFSLFWTTEAIFRVEC